MWFLVVRLILLYSLFPTTSILCSSSSMMNLKHYSLTGSLGANETDRQALLAIKAQIQHDPNRVTSSWNESLEFCLWQGVTCSRQHRQRVTKLELDSLALVGSISPHIGNLSFLRELRLQNNSFTNQIPPQIGQLHRLQVLRLTNNSLNGTIPANLSNCFQLITLGLDGNYLVGKIPPELSFLSKLQIFVLESNNLTGEIPPSLGNISSLEEISLAFNNLEGSIPNSLCQWKNLAVLSLGINKLSGIIPSCIYNLTSIVRFMLTQNQIQGSLPSNLFYALPKLQFFAIATNQFIGVIPSSISNATNLFAFECSENKFTGQVPNLQNLHNLWDFSIYQNNLGSGKPGDLSFISELINATKLRCLQLAENNFGGTLPTSISNLSTNLQVLVVGGNQLYGSIPTGLGFLVNLEFLGIQRNSFTGSIPTDIGRLSRLGRLDLDNNKLSGSIPSSLGNLTLLTLLDLDENNLVGSIPSSLGKYRYILGLALSGNNLNGTIPPQIFGLTSLSIALRLNGNRFTGSLPLEIGNLKNLGIFNVSNNLLSGELPGSIGSCESLEFLHLQGNFFSGPIPSSMKDLRGIQELDLSRNNMSGDIPKFFEGFKNLRNLNLSFNQFSGAVPTGGVFINTSAISVAGNVRLCGGIAKLQLPVCKPKKSIGGGGGGLSHSMKLMISIISGFTLLGISVVLSLFLVGKKRKESKLSTLGNSVLQVSYAAIRKATDGFSSANLIGMGAFGTVYKGILSESEDGVLVAGKVFNMLHRGASKSFISECEVLRNIKHRNLVKIITACSSIDFNGNDFKALIYEFMDNGSLEEWLHPSAGSEEPKSLNLVQRVDIAIDVVSALDYLHNHCETPIVHCDLKPSNVLLDGDLTGHVSDFGLSRFLGGSTTNIYGNHSSSIGIRGSVGYAAPEYGMGSEASAYGDVYSFGILLLEMFTGKRPTDHMFSDNLNLHNYVKTALPGRVLEISEPLVLQEARRQLSVREEKIEECLTLIFGIGISCSVESPTNRKDINDVAAELQSIRDKFLG